MKLSSISWKQAEEVLKEDRVIILPIGSVENHGTHGPLGTDYLIPEKIASMIDKKAKVLVLPVIPYGVCPHHKKFPGTIDIGYDILVNIVRKIVFSLYKFGARRFIFLNGHGGNDSALDTVALELYNKGGIAATIDWWVLAGEINEKWKGGHAGGQEASAMLYVDSDTVNIEESLPLEFNNLTEKLEAININTVKFKNAHIKIMRDVKDVVYSGWFGPDDPKNATIEEGKEMLEKTVDFLVDFINEFEKIYL